MKKKYIVLVVLNIIFLLTPTALIQADVTKRDSQNTMCINTEDTGKQDGRFIEKLQWYSPNGELPGTFNDYLSSHPYTPVYFSTPDGLNTKSISEGSSLAILVDET
jgi:hypothetical protein